VSDLNIGLIGSGRIGQVHAGSIADTKGANLAWICDPFIDGATALAAEFGGKVTADPEDVFKSGEVDVIVVASPTPTHLDMIDRAIDEGIHVLCEKPIDLDIAKVEKLRDKANAANVHIAIGFNRRFDPQFESIQKRVAAGEAGKLEQLVILSRDPGPAPRAYIAVSGGIFRDMTIHDFDMARYFVPDIVDVYAAGANVFSDDIKAENDYDSVSVTMRGRGGEIIVIVNSRHSAYGYDQRLEAFGDKAMFHAHNVSPTTVQKYDPPEPDRPSRSSTHSSFDTRCRTDVNSRCSSTEFATGRTTTQRSTTAGPHWYSRTLPRNRLEPGSPCRSTANSNC